MKRSLMSLALLAMAAIALPAGASTVASAPTAAAAEASPAPASLSGLVGTAAASGSASACDSTRTVAVGDLVVFHAGAHDPVFAAGSQLDAEVVHVWGPTCINVLITDASGERHSRTSVRFLPHGATEPIGHFATRKEDRAATG